MLVVDLHCALGHDFEGWFGSAEDLADQQARGLVSCPVCGGHDVVRRPSAPRLNVSGLKDEAQPASKPVGTRSVAPTSGPGAGDPAETAREAAQALHAMYALLVQEVTARTEDVGERFAEEARRIHHGEAQQRDIRGVATPQETAELLEEGIGVMALPLPESMKTTLQ